MRKRSVLYILPQNTGLKLIKGGNHSQFGYFGALLFDGTAQIDREKQHELTVQYLVESLDQVKKKLPNNLERAGKYTAVAKGLEPGSCCRRPPLLKP